MIRSPTRNFIKGSMALFLVDGHCRRALHQSVFHFLLFLKLMPYMTTINHFDLRAFDLNSATLPTRIALH